MQTLLAFALLSVFLVVPAPAQQSPSSMKIEVDESVDRFPNGCVDCHVRLPDRDVRLSSAMKQWSESVHPALLAKARSAAPAGMELKGRHPKVAAGEIPAACLTCHGKDSTVAPPFGKLIHSIHLSGGHENHYIEMFGRSCTHCHKVDDTSGSLKLASGSERN